MKRCLILGVLSALAASANATQGSAPPAPRPQPVADVQPSHREALTARSVKSPAPPRHLSEQERVELRRQLQQFNQQYTRRQ